MATESTEDARRELTQRVHDELRYVEIITDMRSTQWFRWSQRAISDRDMADALSELALHLTRSSRQLSDMADLLHSADTQASPNAQIDRLCRHDHDTHRYLAAEEAARAFEMLDAQSGGEHDAG